MTAHRTLAPDAVVASAGRQQRTGAIGGLSALLVLAMAVLLSAAAAHAEPPEDPNNPYPDLRYFTEISADPYQVPGQGVWFTSPSGLNCGIWWRGSFGCAGDSIPGAPPDVHQIGWYTGDTRVHYDWTMAVRFPQARGALTLPPLSYIQSEGTTCATPFDGGTYCERGPWRMFITPTHTWLNGTSHAE